MSSSFLAAAASRAADALAGSAALAPAKVVLFVRHGQSMHNISDVAAYGDKGEDAALFDAPLSPLGEQQVAALAGHAELAKADLSVVSPLTRAVQTLLGAFPTAAAKRVSPSCPPVQVWPSMAEHMTDSCDIGSGTSTLASRFPAFDWSPLPEVWWYVDDETSTTDAEDSRRRYRECGFMEPELRMRKRVDAFVDALYAQPERVIAVFGHSDFFNEVFKRHLGIENYWLENAEVYRVELPPARTKTASPECEPAASP